MAAKSSQGVALVSAADAEARQEALQARLAETREAIGGTIGEIKEAMVGGYEAAKQNIEDALDWRQHFRKHPVAWSLGAAAAGAVIGPLIFGKLLDTEAFKRIQDELSFLGEEIADGFGGLGDHLADGVAAARPLLVPALAAAATPYLVKVSKDLTGLDLTNFLTQLTGGKAKGRAKKGSQKRRKKTAAKKKGGKSDRWAERTSKD